MIRETFLVRAADAEEVQRNGESPESFVVRMAELKAKTIGDQLRLGSQPEISVLAADTEVVFQGEVMGKPDHPTHAVSLLERLQGRSHQVISGIALYQPGTGEPATRVAVSEVMMRSLSPGEIADYVASGDPMDKAGAYAIQNDAYQLVRDFQDCFANVMGLPLCHCKLLFEESGLDVPEDVPVRCQASLAYDCPVHEPILRGER